MAFDRKGKVLDDYTYEIAKTAVSEGRDELVVLFNGIIYDIGVSTNGILKEYRKKNPDKYLDDDPFDPLWCCCTENEILLIAPRETIMDEIVIDGQQLEEIWPKITLL